MELRYFTLFVCAFCFLGISIFFALLVVIESCQKQKILWSMGSAKDGSFTQLIFGVSNRVFGSLSSLILKSKFIESNACSVVTYLSLKGVIVEAKTAVSCLILFSFVSACLTFIFTVSLICALCVAFCIFFALTAFFTNLLAKELSGLREQVPDAIRCLSTCVKCGLSLMQTFEQASHECKGALGQVFLLAHNRLNMGSSVSESLEVFESVREIPELKFIAVAFSVHHVTGGPIADVLDCARESVLSELELARTLRIQTAQAKMSASIVTILPFVLLALFSFMSPGFLNPFFSSFVGISILVLALCMQLTGVMLVRKTLAKCEE